MSTDRTFYLERLGQATELPRGFVLKSAGTCLAKGDVYAVRRNGVVFWRDAKKGYIGLKVEDFICVATPEKGTK